MSGRACKPGALSSPRGGKAKPGAKTKPMIKSRLAVFMVLSVLAYLGLVVGAGGPSRFFSYPPLIASIVITIALGLALLFREGYIGSRVREDAWCPAGSYRV
jgi:hypothetical protein